MRRFLLPFSLLVSCLLLAAGCGEEVEPLHPGDPVEQKDGGNGSKDYPEGPFGTEVGTVIKNISLSGYNGYSDDPSDWGTVRLSDFYDPDGEKGYTLLVVNAAALWCGPCKAEAPQLSKMCDDYRSKGAACYVAVMQGVDGSAATIDDVKWWKKEFNVKGAIVNEGPGKWGEFFDAGSIPFNMVIDPKTMKILGKKKGADIPWLKKQFETYAK